MKNLLLVSFLLIFQASFGQFANLKSKHGKSLIHNSIAKSKPSSNFYVVASTVKDGNNYDINLSKLNSNGITVWERELDLKKDDRALDVVVDDNDDILVTGYTGNGKMKRLYIAKFNSSGSLISDFTLQSNISTVGTKIIKSKYSRAYYVSGFTYNQSKSYDMVSEALLISVDEKLTKLNWEAEYSLSSINNTITEIVELPNKNLFITGSLGQNKSGQIILAAIVNPARNGDVIPNGNLSFGVSEDYCLGASAVYDAPLDKIWLLFNAGDNGKPYYIGINSVTSVEPTLSTSGFIIDVNNTPNDKYAAYKIMMSPSNSDGLTIFGYKDQTALYGSGFGLWALDIDKNTAMINGGLKLWNPSGATLNLEHQGGDVLSLFSKSLRTGMPYFHTPEIAVESHKGSRFVALTLDDISGNTEVGVLSFNDNLLFASSPCLKFLDPLRHTFTTRPKGLLKKSNIHGILTSKPKANFASPSGHGYCTIHSITSKGNSVSSDDNVSSKEEIYKESKLKVFPNPTNNLITLSTSGDNSIKELKLINELGQTVIEKSISGIKESVTIDLSKLKKGVYILVSNWRNEKITSERIVKL